MKSLKSITVRNLDLFKNKTLLEIANLCTDGNNSNAAIYRSTLFASRETLMNLFSIYMTITVVDVDDESIYVSADDRELLREIYQDKAKNDAKDRKYLIEILNLRQDVQTSNELWNFFMALSQGFAWNYVIRLSWGWQDHDEEIHRAVPGTLIALRPNPELDVLKLKIVGTLPNEDCMGVSVQIQSMQNDDYNRDKDFYMCWKREEDVVKNSEIKSILFQKIVSEIRTLAKIYNPESDRNVVLNVYWYDARTRDFATIHTEELFWEHKDVKIWNILGTQLQRHKFTFHTSIRVKGRTPRFLITLTDMGGQDDELDFGTMSFHVEFRPFEF